MNNYMPINLTIDETKKFLEKHFPKQRRSRKFNSVESVDINFRGIKKYLFFSLF